MLLPQHHHHREPPRRGGRRPLRGGVAGLASSLAGCLLLGLVATAAMLCLSSPPSRARQHGGSRGIVPAGGSGATPRVTIFSAPRPPPEGSPARQELAARSWLALPWNVSVVLLGAGPESVALAARLGHRVTADAAIDFAFTGTPFFHSMVARAQAAADTDVCVLVDAEIVLLPEIVNALDRFSKVDGDWFLVSLSRNVTDPRYQLADSGSHWVQADGKEVSFTELQEIPAEWSSSEGSDRGLIMAWNNPSSALHAGVLPSFLYGRGAQNWWLAHEVLSSEMRLFFDASSLVLGLYPESISAMQHVMASSKNGRLPSVSWEYGVNHHLAAVYGSYCCRSPARRFPMLHRVVKQSEDYMLSKVDTLVSSDFFISKQGNAHGVDSLRKKQNVSLSGYLHGCSSETSAPDLPYSLSMLLDLVADENGSVVLGVAGKSYRDMLMSWACRLRRLRVTNFLVCALDHETYEFSILQGLPVFRDPLSPTNVSFDDCHFGTKCFQQVTKVKSRIVLEILRLGYNVLLSDVDVYWFGNPMPLLYSLGLATFGAQSDEYNETGPINLPRRLNSGFYFARSDNATIIAMEMIVKHAASSGLSEQPSFYDVLCGENGTNRIGEDRCLEPNTNLTVVFLDRDLFPNGAYKGLWEKRDVRATCKELGCFIIHNNWINKRRKKVHRQMVSGLWDYDPTSRQCLQEWSAQNDGAIPFV
ncbi:beta-arabinofuranosyltransferase RAY1 isoform X1 [Zea mays]|uniref:Beta-arabinofuranosyltransferase RAY1 n=2 Tax=Zea mays TaxID=4577 RepID=A0A1D6M9U4_MAIZE|nr:beta-arabinofuranosyltransferase RAY1 isoform X1 [Zea mays]AQK87569.1 Beta-arabinofuranosyltransferase RAY1 [Zea mays]|eukprot:XP_008649865.1 beta-arabinofuranosyltransferase RAY1 isoform X1 [Zea mays]